MRFRFVPRRSHALAIPPGFLCRKLATPGGGRSGGLIWMLPSHRLRKARLASEYEYRREVLERTGYVILAEDRVVARHGRLLTPEGARQLPAGQEGEVLVPSLVDDDPKPR